MSRRSTVIREQAKLHAKPLVTPFANKQIVPPAPQQMGLGQLVDILIDAGARRGYRVQWSAEGSVVRVLAECGELAIPLDFSPEQARALAATINAAADSADPATPVSSVAVSPEAEELITEFMDRARETAAARMDAMLACPGCSNDLADSQLTHVDGTPMPGAFYCHPCEAPVRLEPAASLDTSWVYGTADPVGACES